MKEEYINTADYLLDLIDKRNELNKEINKTRNRLREIKKPERKRKFK